MNKCIFMGRIATDLELKQSNGGLSILKFKIAVNRIKKEDGADFLPIIAFGKQAETIASYLNKGQQILLETHVQTGFYEKDGAKVYTTDFIVDKFEFIGNASNKEKATSVQEVDCNLIDDGDIPF